MSSVATPRWSPSAIGLALDRFLSSVHLLWPAAAVLALHALFTAGISYPTGMYDEFGPLSYARVFAHVGVTPNLESLSDQPFLYGLIIAPAMAIGNDLFGAYRGALLINCMLFVAGYLALFALARSLGAQRSAAIWLAFVTSCYASALLYSTYTVTQNLVLPLFAVLCWAVVRLVTAPAIPRGALVGALAGALFATHTSAVAIIVALVCALAFAGYRRVVDWRSLTAALVTLAFTLVIGSAIERDLLLVLFHRTNDPSLTQAMQALLSPANWPRVLEDALGQWFALNTVTLGLITFGFVAALRGVRDARFGAFYAFLALSLVGTVLGSAMFTSVWPPESERVNFLFAIRYPEGVVLPVVLVGFFALLQRENRRVLVIAAAASLVISGLAVAPLLPGTTGWFDGWGRRLNLISFAGFVRMLGPASPLTVLAAGAITLGIVLGIGLSRLSSRAAATAFAGAFVLVNLTVAAEELLRGYLPLQNAITPGTSSFRVADAIRARGPGQRIAFVSEGLNPLEFAMVQLVDRDDPVRQVSGDAAVAIAAPIVVAPRAWNGAGYRFGTCEGFADECVWYRAAGGVSFDYAFATTTRVRADGIYPLEGDGETRFHWTNGDARFEALVNPGSAHAVTVHLEAFDPTSVRVVFDGKIVARAMIRRDLVLRIPVVRAPRRIEIVSPTFVPVPVNGYTRRLGVQVHALGAER